MIQTKIGIIVEDIFYYKRIKKHINIEKHCF